MPYTSFAVAGAGPTIGGRIVQALINRGASVVALARPGSSSIQSPLLQGAKIAEVDYVDVKTLTSILREHNVEVVVSALAYGALPAQRPIAEAAKEAGVKLFVPSEYGMPTEGGKEGHPLVKSELADYVKSLGIPVLRVYNGLLMEFIPWLTGVEQLGKVHLLGELTTPCSFTSLEDVSGFVAHVLTTLPDPFLRDATFRIEGERTSLAAIGALYEAGVPPVPVARVTELPEGFVKQTFLQSKVAEGKISSGWDNYIDKDVPENAASGNKAWEGHNWKSVKEVLGL
ncbi:NAD(P)-binding protein [Imleria badia]|nr:NAD(P)-binding protein [Imleria badia]